MGILRVISVLMLSGYLASGCICEGICADVGANFTLTGVAYDPEDELLYASGYQALGYCESCNEEADKFAAIRLVYSVADRSLDADIAKHHSKKIPEAPVEVPRLFWGEFYSGCSGCELRMTTKDDRFDLSFLSTDLLWDRINAPELSPAMLMIVEEESSVIAEIAIGYLEVEDVFEE